jgi:hypothetical protein
MTDEEKLAADKALARAYMEADRFDREASEARVDLKWSLWSAHEKHWQDYAPTVLATLRAGITDGQILETGCGITIRTAPRKEIRFGEVTIYPYNGHLFADISFRSEWDEPSALADTLLWEIGVADASDATYERATEWVREWVAPIITEEETIDLGESPTLAAALAQIDTVEERLLEADKTGWTDTVESFRDAFRESVAPPDAPEAD